MYRGGQNSHPFPMRKRQYHRSSVILHFPDCPFNLKVPSSGNPPCLMKRNSILSNRNSRAFQACRRALSGNVHAAPVSQLVSAPPIVWVALTAVGALILGGGLFYWSRSSSPKPIQPSIATEAAILVGLRGPSQTIRKRATGARRRRNHRGAGEGVVVETLPVSRSGQFPTRACDGGAFASRRILGIFPARTLWQL